MASCVSGQVDANATCGDATLIIRNHSEHTFIVFPQLSRLPTGAQCVQATGFTNDSTGNLQPFTLDPSSSMKLNVPTLTDTSSSSSSSSTSSQDPPAYFPYNAQERIAYVHVTAVLVPADFTSVPNLDAHANDMDTYLRDTVGCDMGTLTTLTFVINTCGQKGFHVSGDDTQSIDLHSGTVMRAFTAQPSNASSATQEAALIHVSFENLQDVLPAPAPGSLMHITPEQEEEIARPWVIALAAAVGVWVLTLIFGMYYWKEYMRHRPLTHEEVRRGMIHHMQHRAEGLRQFPNGISLPSSGVRQRPSLAQSMPHAMQVI